MASAELRKLPQQQVGRYAVFDQIASGGMATVHVATLSGQGGFSRVVAVKRMHPHLLENELFQEMFVSEARLAARVRHPNVVPILDVVAADDELLLVMEYIHGLPLSALLRAMSRTSTPMPEAIVCSIVAGVLHGLHAAHEARDEKGALLGLVHRDVSPQNILVGVDGVARVVDFGIARALRAQQDTNPGVLQGKIAYMAPEVLRGEPATPQSDVFATAAVLWELLTTRRLFGMASEEERLLAILSGEYPSPRTLAPHISPQSDSITMRGLDSWLRARYTTALDMAVALENETMLASARVIGEWVKALGADALAEREALIHQVEASGVNPVRVSLRPASADPNESSAAAQRPDGVWSIQQYFGWVAGAVTAAIAIILLTLLLTRPSASPGAAAAVSAQAARPPVAATSATSESSPARTRATEPGKGQATRANQPDPSAMATEASSAPTADEGLRAKGTGPGSAGAAPPPVQRAKLAPRATRPHPAPRSNKEYLPNEL